jgi:hypothetical protein
MGVNVKNKNQIVKKQNLQPLSASQSADLIISNLAGKDVDTEKLEKLLEIKSKFEAEENRKEYQIAFAELQADLPVIQKTKEVHTKAGNLMYKYAPLEKILEQIKPVLKTHGFSYSWSEDLSNKDGYKRIYCHIMARGHTETNFVDVPIQKATDYVNAVQQAGSSSTYGKRYSLCNALGISVDEDYDATDLKGEQKEDNTEI